MKKYLFKLFILIDLKCIAFLLWLSSNSYVHRDDKCFANAHIGDAVTVQLFTLSRGAYCPRSRPKPIV